MELEAHLQTLARLEALAETLPKPVNPLPNGSSALEELCNEKHSNNMFFCITNGSGATYA